MKFGFHIAIVLHKSGYSANITSRKYLAVKLDRTLRCMSGKALRRGGGNLTGGWLQRLYA